MPRIEALGLKEMKRQTITRTTTPSYL